MLRLLRQLTKRRLFVFTSLAACCLGYGCLKEDFPTYSGQGKRPVYLPLESLTDITNTAPLPIGKTGPIFLRDSLFFIVEPGKGIHVFNVSDSLNVVNMTFFLIPAINDFSISGQRLYADSWKDLVTIDISDIYHIRVLDRQVGVFTPLLFPPLYNGIFECVDESKGAVIDWEDADLDNAECRTVN